MYRNAVQYKGTWLAPGSKAMELYEDSKKQPAKLKELDKHMSELDKKYQAEQKL